jgi:hypothetical protein
MNDGVEGEAPASESARYVRVCVMTLLTASGFRGVETLLNLTSWRGPWTGILGKRSVRVQVLRIRGGLIGNAPAGLGGLLGGLKSTSRDA